ncbi:OmpA family protein [Thalassotalea sp. G2M2-11]|uniref:OmpA family protein n=1 Tax=Thalassotalea sp. G2M2-11 TaxID=2787627 RepID=UPI0019D31CB6|nr:OmpA family protein [Thalassotalea sp. G2M2-11]
MKKTIKIALLSLFVSGIYQTQANNYSTANDNSANNDKVFKPWYVGASVGRADSSATVGKMNRRFGNNGIDAIATEVDDKDFAYDLTLGYSFDRNWSIEAGYKDLGEVLVRVTGNYYDENAFFDRVEHVHPESGKGLFIAGNYHFYFSEDTALYGKIGLFDWQGKYVTSNVGSSVGDDKLDGRELFYGLGLQHDLSSDWSLHAKWERFNFDNDKSNVLSLGITYRFGSSEQNKSHAATKQNVAKSPLIEEPKKPLVIQEESVPESNPDLDGDGVQNAQDNCPNTGFGIKVNNAGCPLLEKITLHVLFDTASSEIKPTFMAEIDAVADNISQYNGKVKVTVEGHTDWVGAQKNNQPLSEARADAVAKRLMYKTGLAASAFSVVGYGELKPVADNNTAQGRFENRRVEVIIQAE